MAGPGAVRPGRSLLGRECTSLPAQRPSVMYRYSVFGGCLASALELPGLPVSSSPDETWRLCVAAGPGGDPTGPLLGMEEVDAGCIVRLHVQANGLRLSYDDTGVFDITDDGRTIEWYPAPGAPEELARLDVIGRVLAAALHLEGILPLHGSGVIIGGRAVAFVAPKSFGKSTLALALVNAGATFLSDDTLPVEPGPVPHARPGVDQIRLWNDSASWLGATDRLTSETASAKHTIVMRGQAPCVTPLSAVYLLAPANRPYGEPAACRDRLAAVPATVALLRHAKLGPLVGGAEATRLLDQASNVAHVVPVYRLEIARDLDRLPEAVSSIMTWHGGAAVGNASGTADGASSAPDTDQREHSVA